MSAVFLSLPHSSNSRRILVRSVERDADGKVHTREEIIQEGECSGPIRADPAFPISIVEIE